MPIALVTFDIDPILSMVRMGLPIARMLAMITTTTWDDQAVGLLEKAATEGSPLLSLLRAVLNDPLVQSTSGDERTAAIHAAMAPHREAIEKASIDWTVLLAYFPQIVTFLLTLFGLRR